MKNLLSGILALAVAATLTGCGDDNDLDEFVATQVNNGPTQATFRVRIQNLTNGQPFSPPIAATHTAASQNLMFEVGSNATAELAAIAQDGNQQPMADFLATQNSVTQVANPGAPLTFAGNQVDLGNGVIATDTLTFDIQANEGDVLSLASMLIATNDGFFGLNSVTLPAAGTATFNINGYDAGVEENNQLSSDIVDPASGLGPVALNGDPNGNSNTDPTNPPTPIVLHPNIQAGTGDLTPGAHAWVDPVARVTVERL